MTYKPLFWVLLLFNTSAIGQTFIMDGTPIASCTGTFLDGGGATGDYLNNQNLTTTICPDGAGSSHILLQFDSTEVLNGDQLCIYDGPNVLAPLLDCSDVFSGIQGYEVQASATNMSGCLTLAFTSDGNNAGFGWSIAISCDVPCILPAPANIQLTNMNNGSMTWIWDAVPGSTGFEISLNGGAWQPAAGPLSHTVTGLTPGSLVVLEIRPISGNPGCSVESITVNKTYLDCNLAASVSNLVDAGCFGETTGSATITVNGALGALSFFLDADPNAYTSGQFTNLLGAGLHQVIVVDSAGCRDTVNFTINEPPAIQLDVTTIDANCFGDNSGSAFAIAGGGAGTFTYNWQGCQGGMVMTGDTIIDLFAGCYAVTVTDLNGCTAFANDTIGEPPMFVFSSSQDSISCFGGMDGMATVSVSGAEPPYTFQWSNGDTTQTADSLQAAFHSVTITDAAGCQAVTLAQVLQPANLIIDSLAQIPIACFGIDEGTLTVFAQGGVLPFSYNWSNTDSGQIITGLGPGTYTVTLTDASGCTAIQSTSLNAPPELQLSLDQLTQESCAGACDGSIAISVSGGTQPYSAQWNSPAIPNDSLNPQNLCPMDYTVVISDANNCQDSLPLTVQEAAPLTISFATQDPLCFGDSNGEIAAGASGGAQPYQYLWSNSQTGNTITGLSCGVYTVTVTDLLNCTFTSSDTLACPIVLQVDSILPQAVQCFGAANGSVEVFAQGGTGALNYLWSDPNQQLDSIALNLPPGTYTVTITDENGCSITASAPVTEPPVLSATVNSTNASCFGSDNGTATIQAMGGVQPFSYNWSNADTTETVTGLSAGSYSVTVTDSNGCSLIESDITISQPAGPVLVTASQTKRACFDASNGAAEAMASGGNGTPFTFAWSNGLNGPNPGAFANGTYTVTATDGNGCTGTQTVEILQWDSIDVNVAFVLPTCNGNSDGQAAINLVSGGAGNNVLDNYMFSWSVPGTTDTIYINGLPGNQNYGLTVTDIAGCSAVFDFFLDDQLPIVPDLQADSISCFGQSDGQLSVVGVQSTRPISDYTWSNSANGQVIDNLAPGTYTVVATDTQGCTGSASATVFEPPPLDLALDIESLICNDDSNGVIQATASGGTPGYSYFWNIGTSNQTISGLGPGTYTVLVTDANGCTDLDSTFLSQPNPPEIQIDLIPPSCFGEQDGVAQLVVNGGSPPYRFSLDGQTFSGSSVFLGLAAGDYNVLIQDNEGCTSTVSFTLNEPPPVQTTLGPDTSLLLGDSLLLTPTVTNAAGQPIYSWQSSLVDTFSCDVLPECSAIWVSPVYNNTYSVLVTDENGCQSTASISIEVEKPRGVYVPSGFSPNGDGNNDLLIVHGKSRQIRRVNVFRIFDRWGELVYEDANFDVNDLQRGWNGQFRGEDCQSGVYVWYVEVEYLDGFEQSLRGNTTLIR